MVGGEATAGSQTRGVMGEARGVMGEARGVMGEARGVMGEARGVKPLNDSQTLPVGLVLDQGTFQDSAILLISNRETENPLHHESGAGG